MRFCPFCSAENGDELAVCQSCGRRLPPLPPRRAGNAPATGVQLPPRPPGAGSPPPLPVRKAGTTTPPPGAAASPPSPPAILVTSAGFAPAAPSSSGLRSPAEPSPPSPARPALPEAARPLRDEGARALANALSPGPAAQRREAPPPAPADAGLDPALDPALGGRRRSDPLATAPESSAGKAPVVGPPGAAAISPRAPAGFSDDFDTQPPATPLAVDPTRRRGEDDLAPPPTRIHRPEALVDRPFTPPTVSPVPEIPEPGLLNSARYTVRFARARWQRRGAIKTLGADIKKDTDALDQVLGALGGVARTAKVDGRVFSGENAAITAAEQRGAQMTREHDEAAARKLEENSRFVDVERERNTKLAEAERMVDEAQKELTQLEAQRRGLRDKRKEIERRQKAYLKAAEDSDRQSGGAELGDSRQELRRAAEQHRREAAALEPDRQEIDRRLASLDRPISEATARLDAAKAELDAAKRSLSDAREGHTHRLAELDAEQKRKAREIAQAEAEIARRLVTLGTLVNLNRVEDPRFAELYQRIDRLRGAITARTTEIEKLSAEREAYDRGNLARGLATIGGAILLFIALIVILRAVLLR